MGAGRVLVVEDDNELLSYYVRMLKRAGYIVIPAGRGAEAIGFQRAMTFDMVLCDYVLPDMEGAQLVERLRARDPSLPILVVSAQAVPPEVQASCWCVQKPVPMNDLLVLVNAGVAERWAA